MERIAPLLGRISRGALYVLPHLVERFAPPLARGWLAAAIFLRSTPLVFPVRDGSRRGSFPWCDGAAAVFGADFAGFSGRRSGNPASTPPSRGFPGLTDAETPADLEAAAMTISLPARRLASSFLAAIAAFAFATAFAAATASAQTTVTLDGTSGSELDLDGLHPLRRHHLRPRLLRGLPRHRRWRWRGRPPRRRWRRRRVRGGFSPGGGPSQLWRYRRRRRARRPVESQYDSTQRHLRRVLIGL